MAENGYTWSKWKVISVASLSLGLMLGGCGSSGDDDDDSSPSTEESPTPPPPFQGTIEITVPAEGGELPLDFDKLTAGINYDVAYFDVMAEGACGTNPNCGQVEVKIDGDGCNASGASYNNRSSKNPVTAYFEHCSEPLGDHTVTLTLIYEGGEATEASASVSMTATLPEPVFQFADPIPNEVLFEEELGGKLSITFALSNWNLMDPGTCGNLPNCGHVYLLLDKPEDSSDYDALVGTTTPNEDGTYTVEADISGLSDVTGPHTLVASLRDDNGGAYVAADNETNVGDTVEFDVSGEDDPRIEVVSVPIVESPTAGDDDDTPTEEDGEERPVVELGDDGYMSVPVTFSVSNFNLLEDCSGDQEGHCGHVHVLLDAGDLNYPEQGNAPEVIYNNSGVGEADGLNHIIDARFYWLAFNGTNPTGAHSITLALYDDNEQPIVASDFEVNASKPVSAQSNADKPFLNITSPRANATVNFPSMDDLVTNVAFQIDSGDTTDLTYTMDTCADVGGKTCVHFRAFLDDDHGNVAPNDYHAATAELQVGGAGRFEVDFQALIDNGFEEGMFDEGNRHRIGVVLYNKDGSEYQLLNDDGTSLAVGSWRYVELTNNVPQTE